MALLNYLILFLILILILILFTVLFCFVFLFCFFFCIFCFSHSIHIFFARPFFCNLILYNFNGETAEGLQLMSLTFVCTLVSERWSRPDGMGCVWYGRGKLSLSTVHMLWQMSSSCWFTAHIHHIECSLAGAHDRTSEHMYTRTLANMHTAFLSSIVFFFAFFWILKSILARRQQHGSRMMWCICMAGSLLTLLALR